MAIPTPRPADGASEPDLDAPLEPLRLSIAHYHKMAEAGILEGDRRCELIHGVIYTMAPIDPKHATRVKTLEGRLERCFGDRAVVFTQHPLRLSEGDEPQPDVLVVKPSIDEYEERHPSPEDALLVAEVAHTTLESDRTLKQGLYARAGILEYWILDLAKNRLEVYCKPDTEEGRYLELKTLGEGEGATLQALADCGLEWWH